MKFGFFPFLVVILGVSTAWAQSPSETSSASSVAATPTSSSNTTPDSQANPSPSNGTSSTTSDLFTPKVMIVTLFEPERNAWTVGRNISFTRTVDVPGLSPLFPNITCTSNSDICLATLGEGEINAASSMTALLYNSKFNLTQTYFVVNGIAGINPAMGTIGSVGFPRYAVQFGLQYGLDGREVPANWSSSFWNYGTSQPDQYPGWFYGTEVFGLNTALRDKVFSFATQALLNDTQLAQEQRAAYPTSPARNAPAVFQGDVMTSDLYYTGAMFGDMAANITLELTNHTGAYALTAQEDNAVLETLVRAHKACVADYGRTILYRSASDFDRGA